MAHIPALRLPFFHELRSKFAVTSYKDYIIEMATGCSSSEEERPTSSASGVLKNPFVGNVSKFVPLLPSEQKAAVKKGRLQFDACFESGQPHPSFRNNLTLPVLCREPGEGGLH